MGLYLLNYNRITINYKRKTFVEFVPGLYAPPKVALFLLMRIYSMFYVNKRSKNFYLTNLKMCPIEVN